MKEELLNVSPIDGRYKELTKELDSYFSEYALTKQRVVVEINWLIFLMDKNIINVKADINLLKNIINDFNVDDAIKVKEEEAITNHDVKAVEYYLRKKFISLNIGQLNPYIHFLLTSEDVNSVAYALLIKEGLNNSYKPHLNNIIDKLDDLSSTYYNIPMLSHTHGQPATPTTVGKEFKVFSYRLKSLLNQLNKIEIKAKFSGTVGNYNAHKIAYPHLDWPPLVESFISSLGLSFNPITTQIEPHDDLCLLLSIIKIINNVISDLDNDMWLYISLNYFKEKVVDKEVGSSIMPHKVNPINYENSLANCQLSNGLIDALVNNLSISRMQRDLSDSSKLRNIGSVFAYSLIAYKQTLKGLNKIIVNEEKLSSDLDNNWEVLSEAIQTILRKNGVDDAYEQLKALSRGNKIGQKEITDFVKNLEINEEDKNTLLDLLPQKYIGLAENLAKRN